MSEQASNGIDKRRVQSQFNKAARSYDAHDFVQREVLSRAEERLDYISLSPSAIVDLGSGTGRGARALSKRYRQARITHCDLAPAMLSAARAIAPRWFSRQQYVCADIERLPFAPALFDLAFSSLSLQWCLRLDAAFKEVRRVLRPGGLFLFTTLGPDTLFELRAAFAAVSTAEHVNAFIDMHEIGDVLGSSGFSDPVMETEYLTVEYNQVVDLLRDLKGIGAANATDNRPRSMFGRHQMKAMTEAYETHRRNGKLPATYEVVYGHAWVVEGQPRQSGPEHTFPLAQLRRRK